MATTTNRTVGIEFTLGNGSKTTKSFSDISELNFTNDSKISGLVTKYPKIVDGTAKKYSKTTKVTTDIE